MVPSPSRGRIHNPRPRNERHRRSNRRSSPSSRSFSPAVLRRATGVRNLIRWLVLQRFSLSLSPFRAKRTGVWLQFVHFRFHRSNGWRIRARRRMSRERKLHEPPCVNGDGGKRDTYAGEIANCAWRRDPLTVPWCPRCRDSFPSSGDSRAPPTTAAPRRRSLRFSAFTPQRPTYSITPPWDSSN
jgi:hypothetical protein